MSNGSSDSNNSFKCDSEEHQHICNFFYSLALTEVVYAVVPQRVWDYRKLIEAKYPYKGKLYKLLAGSSVVHAVDGNSGQKTFSNFHNFL